MSENLSALFYLAASVFFILALRGLSSPQTARAGNFYGIAGMAIAVATTLASPHVVTLWLIVLGFLLGGAIGTWIALRIQMTALPQLVAAFHSLVGLAAVCVAAAAFRGCCNRKVNGLPLTRPCNLANATTDPVKVTAPIAVPIAISTRLSAKIARRVPIP